MPLMFGVGVVEGAMGGGGCLTGWHGCLTQSDSEDNWYLLTITPYVSVG